MSSSMSSKKGKILVGVVGVIIAVSVVLAAANEPPSTSNKPQSKLEKKLNETIFEKCQEIEGSLWELVGARLGGKMKLLIIAEDNDTTTLSVFNRSFEGENFDVILFKKSEVNETLMNAVSKVLAHYGLPLRYPILIAIAPPVIFLHTGSYAYIAPDPQILEWFKEYHPYYLFSNEGYSIAIVLKDYKKLNESVNLSTMLTNDYGIPVMVYYDVDRYGASSTKVLDDIFPEYANEDYVVIARNGSLVWVGKYDEALEKINEIVKELKERMPRVENASVYFFYSPTCPHCHEIMPFVNETKANYTDVPFVYCDLSSNESCQKLAQKYGVEFVPTVVVFVNGEPTQMMVGTKEIREQLPLILERIEELKR